MQHFARVTHANHFSCVAQGSRLKIAKFASLPKRVILTGAFHVARIMLMALTADFFSHRTAFHLCFILRTGVNPAIPNKEFRLAMKAQDFNALVNRWGRVDQDRDHDQEVSERAMICVFIFMALDGLEGTFLEHADRIRKFREMTYGEGSRSDVGFAEEEWESQPSDAELGTFVTNNYRFYWRGLGHIANDRLDHQGRNGEDKEDKGDFAGRTKGIIRGRTMFSGRAWDSKKRRVLWFARTVESADILGDVGRSIQQNPWKHANEGEEHCFHQTAFREGDASWWVKCVCSRTQTMAPSSGVAGYHAVKGASEGILGIF